MIAEGNILGHSTSSGLCVPSKTYSFINRFYLYYDED